MDSEKARERHLYLIDRTDNDDVLDDNTRNEINEYINDLSALIKSLTVHRERKYFVDLRRYWQRFLIFRS